MDGGTLGLYLFDDVASARQVLVFDAIDYGLPARHAQGAARRRGARLGRDQALAAPDRLQRRAGAGAIARHRSPSGSRVDRRAAGRARRLRRQPARRRCAPGSPKRSSWRCANSPPGAIAAAPRAAGAPVAAAQRPVAGARRLRGRPPVGGRRLPHRRSRGCWRPRAGATGSPDHVHRHAHAASVEPGDGRPRSARAAGARERLNCCSSASSRRAPGCSPSRARASRGARRRRGGADQRRARRAGGGARRRRPTSTRFFADLVDREPELPAHLPKETADGRDTDAASPTAPTCRPSHPLVAQLWSPARLHRARRRQLRRLRRRGPAHALLVFTEDPVRFKETLDLAVIVPELAARVPGALPRRRAAAGGGARAARRATAFAAGRRS